MIQEPLHVQFSAFNSQVVTLFCAVDGFDETCEEMLERRNQLSAADRKPLIVVADDEALIRDTILEILRYEGYDVLGVQDGNEAIACAVKMRPDVFLADVSMPRLNGIEAAKKIKHLLPRTHIICFSGHAATSELLAQARKDGDEFEFLVKPIRPETLIRHIRARIGTS
jgi:response regulator NasT